MFFYLPPEQWKEPLRLAGQEARHIARVLRLKPGAELRLLDGAGREALFCITAVRNEYVELAMLSEKTHPANTRRAILAVAWSKAIRRGFFLEKAVELGAAEIWCWQARRSQGSMPADLHAGWHGQLVAGMKQCGNPYIPLTRALPGGASELAAQAQARPCILFDAAGKDRPVPELALFGQEGATVYIIGPEGGFDPREADMLINAGCRPASLGERPLRWETAAVMCLSLHLFASISARRSPEASPAAQTPDVKQQG